MLLMTLLNIGLVFGNAESDQEDYNRVKNSLSRNGFGRNNRDSELSSEDAAMNVNSDNENPGRDLIRGFFKRDPNSQKLIDNFEDSGLNDPSKVDESSTERFKGKNRSRGDRNEEFSSVDLLNSNANSRLGRKNREQGSSDTESSDDGRKKKNRNTRNSLSASKKKKRSKDDDDDDDDDDEKSKKKRKRIEKKVRQKRSQRPKIDNQDSDESEDDEPKKNKNKKSKNQKILEKIKKMLKKLEA